MPVDAYAWYAPNQRLNLIFFYEKIDVLFIFIAHIQPNDKIYRRCIFVHQTSPPSVLPNTAICFGDQRTDRSITVALRRTFGAVVIFHGLNHPDRSLKFYAHRAIKIVAL